MDISKLIKDTIQPELKLAGFRKKAFCWNRYRGSLVDVCTVQMSKGSEDNHLQFTLNVGVFVPKFYDLVWGKSVEGFIEDADCALRTRIGPCVGGDWWNVTGETDVEQLEVELRSCFTNNALSFWDSISSFVDIYRGLINLGNWEKQYWLIQLYTAIAANLNGDTSLSSTILDNLCNSKNKALAEKARAVESSLEVGDKAE